MKKIGIFTFHRSINYGAFMQSYSLSKIIQRRFPEAKVEIIDYTSAIMENNYKLHLNFRTLKHPLAAIAKSKQRGLFRDSLKRLPLSQKSMCCDGDTERVLRNYQNDYDVFVVGSDAVWNWCKRGFPNPYLMNFDGDVVKMSYAASAFGMGHEFVGEKEREYWENSLSKFSFVGVRDAYTAELVKDVCPACEPVFTCDPTVFLELEDVYSEIGMTKDEFKIAIYNKFKIPHGKKVIGIMGAPKEVVSELKKKYGDEVVLISLFSYARGADVQIVKVNPFEWVALFGLFDLTVTSYFHGTLLSLRNGTPVINVDFGAFSKKYEGKIHDVMRRMDLLECHVSERNSTEKIMEQIACILSKKEQYKEKIRDGVERLKASSEVFFEELEKLL